MVTLSQISIIIAFVTNLVSAQCPGGMYAAVASGVAGYEPAQSYCSKRFPVLPKTNTNTATATVTAIVATITETTTASTTTEM